VPVKYRVELIPRAAKDLRNLPAEQAVRVTKSLRKLANDLAGDVKKLTRFKPGFRLRVGDYRVLFEVEKETVVVYAVKHRREAYQ
jgi:mRNA interferase RelE/StbE